MRKIGLKEFMLGLFIVCIFIFWLNLASIIDTNYKMNGVVNGVMGNTVSIIDETGKEWIITNNDNYVINDNIIITIDNNHTMNINDDIIIKVKKINK